MIIAIVVVVIALLALIALPQYYTKKIIKQYSSDLDYLPGTGGQFAEHLISKLGLKVKLEEVEKGNHYDPVEKKVRLETQIIQGKSISSVAIAAHEVGHAIQDQIGWHFFKLRMFMIKFLAPLQIIGNSLILISPVIGFAVSPRVSFILLAAGFVFLFSRVLIALVNLPVEFDASFGKALPIIKKGEYLSEGDYKSANKILKACAMTYVSSTLVDMLNIFRWLRFLRF